MDRGRPCLISAPSGAGKTTIVRQLVGMLPRLVHSVSYTTRPIRSGERDGRDYHFVDQETFDAMVARDAFVEWAVVHGQQYGTPRDPLERWLANGTDVLLDL
ncbi:MAG: guanylate kinase, partial [Deltaproteobacteria bacterium]|nr:guanylate kinase [Deltaproteobacteria bacterium]